MNLLSRLIAFERAAESDVYGLDVKVYSMLLLSFLRLFVSTIDDPESAHLAFGVYFFDAFSLRVIVGAE